MIHRLVSVHMTEDNFQTELNIIKTKVQNNGYEPDIIDSFL